MSRVTRVAALILLARISDHRGGELRLHLEGGDQGVLGLHDLVARFSVQLESNGEQQGGSPLRAKPSAKKRAQNDYFAAPSAGPPTGMTRARRGENHLLPPSKRRRAAGSS